MKMKFYKTFIYANIYVIKLSWINLYISILFKQKKFNTPNNEVNKTNTVYLYVLTVCLVLL